MSTWTIIAVLIVSNVFAWLLAIVALLVARIAIRQRDALREQTQAVIQRQKELYAWVSHSSLR